MGCANVAATLHHHKCTHPWHGYTQGPGRWGDGEGTCPVEVDGRTYHLQQGDGDCSSTVVECWKVALEGTPYEGALDTATYTGNMRSVFVGSGLFEWHPMGDGYVAQRGDIYLNEANHTAMCQSAEPDMLSEFLSNEHGTITGGAVGDQTGYESVVREYYDFPWDGILAYNGKADSAVQGGHTPVPNVSGGSYECVVDILNVRGAPSLAGSVVASYTHGETVVLDDWSKEADGYLWGRYTSYSGAVRYIAIGTSDGGETYLRKL
ncbi:MULTISPECIES: hypothetical protein [Gordonibacter]|uniref:SH3b domain-containing protein n=1 Tax=Gordonibacter faecis TaxID=3047475 RepID=A0ABT7DPY8_9ACTN|nr:MULTISPECIES: hypothetical protein [unclassified Gordonibacter]MDJ1651615.1 hypothetical protein [Gordonibacter sp. KGMB12511]HIW77037.1 SH3 domain-containing protein [Candidatus Gordonibacter avicola]